MGMLRVLSMALAALALTSVAASAAVGSGLRGKVALYPTRPVCIEGRPCSKPAPGVLIVFSRNGRAAARVTTTRDGSYCVRLGPGVYTVTAPRYRRGSGVTPRRVRVPKGRTARVDLEIDTGIQ